MLHVSRAFVTDYRYHVRCHLMTHYRAFCHRMSHYSFLLPIHYLLPTEWQCRPGGQLGNSYKSSSASPSTFATYFVYIAYLISIDLESSRSFNSSHCKAYSYDPGLHHLLTNQILPHLRSHYFYYLCSVLSFFTYQTNGRSSSTNVPERTRTN